MRTAEHFVNDKEIATAVIFPNGIETLKEFAGVENGKILDDFFVRITESSIERVMNPQCGHFFVQPKPFPRWKRYCRARRKNLCTNI